MRDQQVIVGVRIGALGLEEFVLGVEQVQQGALADIELLAIGIVRLFRGKLVLIEVAQLLGQLAGVVVGDGHGLSHVAADLVAQVLGDIDLVGILAGTRLIGEAIEQVPGQQHLGRAVVGATAYSR